MQTTGLVFIKVFLTIVLTHSIGMLKGSISVVSESPTIACQIWVKPMEKVNELSGTTVPTKFLRVPVQFY